MGRTNVPRRILDRELPSNAAEIMEDLPLLVDKRNAARILGVSESYLDKSRCEGVLKGRTPAPKFVRVEGRVFYKRSTLTEWLESLEEMSTV